MKADIAKLWIDALTSGEFQQDTLALKGDTGHCCLGVLCELYMKDTGMGHWEESLGVIGHGFKTERMKSPSFSHLPEEVLEWAGMQSSEGAVHDTTLVILNDRDHVPFDKIAKIIEINVDEL